MYLLKRPTMEAESTVNDVHEQWNALCRTITKAKREYQRGGTANAAAHYEDVAALATELSKQADAASEQLALENRLDFANWWVETNSVPEG